MKLLAVGATFLLACVTHQAETFSWKPNPETNVLSYRVSIGTNVNVLPLTFTIKHPQSSIQFTALDGLTYTLGVVAILDDTTESEQSLITYVRNAPPPPTVPVPPAVNVLGKTVGSYDRATDTWRNYRLEWTFVNLPDYGATNYTVRKVTATSTNLFASTANWINFGTLKVEDTWFDVYIVGASGTSPKGKVWFQSGQHPQKPVELKVLP